MTPNSANRDVSHTWEYHNGTKHSEWSIRSNRHYLDWPNQPLPLKIYTTVDPIPLPRDADQTGISALSAISATEVAAEGERIPTLADLARIFYFSAGITKKRTYPSGAEIYFRAASCTGALYQFELYLVCGDLPDLKAGVYHFGPGDFALRLLRSGDYRACVGLNAPAVIVCAGTYWRNAWKYRARAYRHFGWDNGTILANMLAITAALQLPAAIHCSFIDADLNALLDLDTAREVAFSIAAIGRSSQELPAAPLEIPKLNLPTVPLSQTEVDYPEMRAMHEASSLTDAGIGFHRHLAKATFPRDANRMQESADPIEKVILRRGSTRKFSRQSITRDQLLSILECSLGETPADFPPLNDVYLIINAVDDMAPGAYVYHREAGTLECLKEGDFRSQARHLGLQQDLPGDAAVDIFFLANLESILERYGNRGYRAVQLEAGILGGRVYLAAYALHVGATGLTFFDDDVTTFFTPHAEGKTAIFLVAVGKAMRMHNVE